MGTSSPLSWDDTVDPRAGALQFKFNQLREQIVSIRKELAERVDQLNLAEAVAASSQNFPEAMKAQKEGQRIQKQLAKVLTVVKEMDKIIQSLGGA